MNSENMFRTIVAGLFLFFIVILLASLAFVYVCAGWTLLCERLTMVIFVVSMANFFYFIVSYPHPVTEDDVDGTDATDATDAPVHVMEKK